MNQTPQLPFPDPTVKSAAGPYVEFYASAVILNNTLKVALLTVCLVCAGLIYNQVRLADQLRNVKPVVIRISESGRPEVLDLSTSYRPREAEIKYFLIQFVQNHYGRIRATVREDYAQSLYFLDNSLATSIIQANNKSKMMETFLTDQSGEIGIRVTSVAIEDLRKAPYRATVDFEKIYYGADRSEIRREKYLGNFVFAVRESVTNAMVPVNPLGLTITYFREDQTFQP